MSASRVGVLGGTFDPIHRGHLAAAAAARNAHRLDRVLLVPSGVPPHKSRAGIASAADRLAMTELAAAGEGWLEASDIEVRRPGVSYTVDTLAELSRARPEDELFFIVGADSLADLGGWRELPRIFDLARVVVVNRSGFGHDPDPDLLGGLDAGRMERLRRDRATMPAVDVASTEVRERAARGEPIDDLVPAAVARFIVERGLYRPVSTS